MRSAGIGGGNDYGSHLGVNSRTLHLVEDVSGLFQVGDVSTVWVESSVPRCSFGKGINEEFLNAARVNLEM